MSSLSRTLSLSLSSVVRIAGRPVVNSVSSISSLPISSVRSSSCSSIRCSSSSSSDTFVSSNSPPLVPAYKQFVELGTGHRGNLGGSAMQYIASVPPIEVDGPRAVCDGGDAALGHPIEYIQLNKVRIGEPETCKYCGLRYVMKQHH